MHVFPRTLAVAAALAFAPVASFAQPADQCGAHSAAALDAMVHGDYEGARTYFTGELRTKMDAATLRKTWAAVQAQAGAYGKRGEPQRHVLDGHAAEIIELGFAHMPLDAVFACDKQGGLLGFNIAPPATVQLSMQVPPLAPVKARIQNDGIRIEPLTVTSPAGPLQGVLTLPPGKGPFPAMVMVAGSGAHDRDEAIGPNKPFHDLAQGLAKLGVASLRYDKRNRVYPETWADKSGIDIDSEVTDDAVTAVRLLASQEGIDAQRVFVLGHSLGAMMAPRIGQRDPQLAGLILMAAPARPIFDVLMQQSREQSIKMGLPPEQVQHNLQLISDEQKLLAGIGPDQAAPKGEFNGGSQRYWLSWSRVDPVAIASHLQMPMFILQGGGDFQVSPTLDFALWKKAMAGNPHVSLHEYAGLSHLFMPAGKTGTPADYLAPGHVDARVVADVAAWVKAQAPAGAGR